MLACHSPLLRDIFLQLDNSDQQVCIHNRQKINEYLVCKNIFSHFVQIKSCRRTVFKCRPFFLLLFFAPIYSHVFIFKMTSRPDHRKMMMMAETPRTVSFLRQKFTGTYLTEPCRTVVVIWVLVKCTRRTVEFGWLVVEWLIWVRIPKFCPRIFFSLFSQLSEAKRPGIKGSTVMIRIRSILPVLALRNFVTKCFFYTNHS